MAFRFSIKWLLIGTAYAALAAAALAQPYWIYTDLLWAANFLCFVYAIILIYSSQGARRLRAAGFATGCVLLTLCLQFGAEAVPANRLVINLGANPSGGPSGYYGATYATPQPYAPTVIRYAPPTFSVPQIASGAVVAPMGAPPPTAVVFAAPSVPSLDFASRFRAANNLSVMLAGMAGLLLTELALPKRGVVTTPVVDVLE